MGLAFTGTERAEVAELRRFLAAAFGTPDTAPFLDGPLLEWKYFCPRPGWSGPRSYLLRQGRDIAAHGCAHPVRFLTPAGEVTSTRIIDWAAAGGAPGAGVLLFRKFAALADTLLAVGGTRETQAILPRIGFERVGELRVYARPVRPWRQFRARPEGGWKRAARLARNAAWTMRPLAGVGAEWSAEPVTRFGSLPLPGPRLKMTVARRSDELLSTMLGCPSAALSGFQIRRAEAVRGYFLLSRVRGQTRIADLWIDSNAPADWRTAYSLAARAARGDPATAEVMAAACDPFECAAIQANGFVARGAEPVFLYDPQRRLAGAPPLRITLLDGDEFYLDNPDYPFLT
jgi:hypothetical protein